MELFVKKITELHHLILHSNTFPVFFHLYSHLNVAAVTNSQCVSVMDVSYGTGNQTSNMGAQWFFPVVTRGIAAKEKAKGPKSIYLKNWSYKKLYKINAFKTADRISVTWNVFHIKSFNCAFFRHNVVRASVSQLVLIGCVLTCLFVTSSRMVLIGQIGHGS